MDEISAVQPIDEPDWLLVEEYRPSISTDTPTPCEQANHAIKQADELLDDFKKGTFVKPIQTYLQKLEDAQRTLFVLARRTSPTFAEDAAKSHKNNVASVDLDPKQAYEALGVSSEDGTTLPHTYFLSKITEEFCNPTTTEQRKRELRQLKYVFADPLAQEEYNAYRKGPQALEALMLSQEESQQVARALNDIVPRVMVLKDLEHTLSRVANAVPTTFPQDDTIKLQ